MVGITHVPRDRTRNDYYVFDFQRMFLKIGSKSKENWIEKHHFPFLWFCAWLWLNKSSYECHFSNYFHSDNLENWMHWTDTYTHLDGNLQIHWTVQYNTKKSVYLWNAANDFVQIINASWNICEAFEKCRLAKHLENSNICVNLQKNRRSRFAWSEFK